MLAPETVPADGSRGATNLKENAHQTSSTPNNGVTAPIAELSRSALKDAVLELGAGARKTWDASSAAVFQLWQVAEKRLGVEVDIEDPAIESIFALHVLAVEDLCDRVRAQADATLAAVEVWNQPQLSNASDGFKFIATANGAADDGGNIVAQLQEADEAMAASKAILRSKLQSEVYSVLDQRLKHHDAVRENVRNRKRWRATAATARRDVVRFRKEGNPNRSELRSLSSGQTDSLEEAENRLKEANEKVAELDIAILTLLTELRESSVDDVRRPWGAVTQLQAGLYLAQQATWATLEEALVEFAGDSLAGASSSLPHSRGEEALSC